MITKLGLSALWRRARIAYYEWALREMPPLHPDIPHVVRRLAELRRCGQ